MSSPSPAPTRAPSPRRVAVVGHLVPGSGATGRSAARWVAGAGWGLAAVLAWSGALPAALVVAALTVPLALALAPLGSGGRVRSGLSVGLIGLALGALVTVLSGRRAGSDPLGSTGVPPWAPPLTADVAALIGAAVVGLVLTATLATLASRRSPADRLRLAALAGAAYAGGAGLVRVAALLGAGGLAGTDPVPWLLLVAVIGLATPAVLAGAVALAVTGSGAGRPVRWMLAALVWGGYAWAAYGSGFAGPPALGLLLTAVVGWFLAGLLSLGLGGRVPDPAPEGEPLRGRPAVRVFRLGAVVLVVLAAVGSALGARTPAAPSPATLAATAPAGAAGGATQADIGEGVTLAVPAGWELVGADTGRVWLSDADGLRARVLVTRQSSDAVPFCEQLVREAPRSLLATRTWGCRQGPIVGKLDTATGAFAGLYAGPLLGARLVDSLGVGHRFDGLSVVVAVVAGVDASTDPAGRPAGQPTGQQAGSQLYAAALAALDAAP